MDGCSAHHDAKCRSKVEMKRSQQPGEPEEETTKSDGSAGSCHGIEGAPPVPVGGLDFAPSLLVCLCHQFRGGLVVAAISHVHL